jgi:uncharacterized protein YndB with AHSA1/START domain
MNKLVVIASAAAVGVACVGALAVMKSRRFTVRRTVHIQAPMDTVYALIDDLRRWPEWSADENGAGARQTYDGTARGRGAIAEWDGDGRAGKVRLEIVESSPRFVRVQADWARPFSARNFNEFTLDTVDAGVRLTWTLDAERVPVLRVMTVFVNPDRLMGSHLSAGLAALKSAAESPKK